VSPIGQAPKATKILSNGGVRHAVIARGARAVIQEAAPCFGDFQLEILRVPVRRTMTR